MSKHGGESGTPRVETTDSPISTIASSNHYSEAADEPSYLIDGAYFSYGGDMVRDSLDQRHGTDPVSSITEQLGEWSVYDPTNSATSSYQWSADDRVDYVYRCYSDASESASESLYYADTELFNPTKPSYIDIELFNPTIPFDSKLCEEPEFPDPSTSDEWSHYGHLPIATREHQGSASKEKFACNDPGCKKIFFRRPADLDRHQKMVHGEDRPKRSVCDYKKCTRHSQLFYRQDHLRDHLRDYHKEDLLRRGLKPDGRWWAERSPRAITDGWWRCSRCLTKRVDFNQNGYICPDCGNHCELDRQKYRAKLAGGDEDGGNPGASGSGERASRVLENSGS